MADLKLVTDDMPLPEVTGRISELEGYECYALTYCQAVICGGSAKAEFEQGEARLNMSGFDKRNLLQKGLNRLAERGWITLVRTGEGDYEPGRFLVKIEEDSGLILREGA